MGIVIASTVAAVAAADTADAGAAEAEELDEAPTSEVGAAVATAVESSLWPFEAIAEDEDWGVCDGLSFIV